MRFHIPGVVQKKFFCVELSIVSFSIVRDSGVIVEDLICTEYSAGTFLDPLLYMVYLEGFLSDVCTWKVIETFQNNIFG